MCLAVLAEGCADHIRTKWALFHVFMSTLLLTQAQKCLLNCALMCQVAVVHAGDGVPQSV